MKFNAWHIADRDTANEIIDNGFQPEEGRRGFGVGVLMHKGSAAAQLRAIKRMNRFKTKADVKKYFIRHGVPRAEVEQGVRDHEERVRGWKQDHRPHIMAQGWQHDSAPGLFYHLQLKYHRAAGGPAGIPYNEFLHGERGNARHVGRNVVAVQGSYDSAPHETRRVKTMSQRGGLDAEHFALDLGRLRARKVLSADELIGSVLKKRR